MAALNAALGSIPPSRPDPAWGAMRPDDDDLHQRPRAGRGAGARWGAALAVLAALGLGAWQWQEHRTAEELLRRLANTSLGSDETPPQQAAAGPPAVAAPPAQEPAPVPAAPAPPPVAETAPAPREPAVAAAPAPEAAPVSARGDSEDVSPSEDDRIKAQPPAAGPAPAPAEPAVKVAAPQQASSPRAACGSRTNFSLYYCMQTQCRQGHFFNHPQCIRLREDDEVE